MSRFFVPALDGKVAVKARASSEKLAALPFTLVQWLDGRWVDVVHAVSRSGCERRYEAMRDAWPESQLRILEHDGSNAGFQEALALLSSPHAVKRAVS